jgi:hypothetical protein
LPSGLWRAASRPDTLGKNLKDADAMVSETLVRLKRDGFAIIVIIVEIAIHRRRRWRVRGSLLPLTVRFSDAPRSVGH